jgi:hypothetical protein
MWCNSDLSVTAAGTTLGTAPAETGSASARGRKACRSYLTALRPVQAQHYRNDHN